ncbi:MAG: VCBS repeat-containing protein, partial [Cyclobacteriaceae bacterium]|nr:VCBS repeat-containing protein [Cyclobacteriaceae bacterium]
HYLRFILEGEDGNTNAFGTRISVMAQDNIYILEHLPTRGFQSTVDNRPLMGIGTNTRVDVEVRWPSGKITKMADVAADQELILRESDGSVPTSVDEAPSKSLYVEMDSSAFPAKHIENQFNDFSRDKLIFEMVSTQGPCLCQGDINNDGLDDLFIGGAKGFRGEVYGQNTQGRFEKIEVKVFDRTKLSEDVDCALFDANGDGNLDLYVASGGNEFNPSVPEMNDRLYFGHGNFEFTLVRQTLPAEKFESSSVVEPSDFDGDGDIDLFVGIRLKPYFYGEPNNGYILENDGTGIFTNISDAIAPGLENIGMITDAKWTDLDNDEDLDLILVGEWMPIMIFINNNGTFRYNENLFQNSNGWWNVIETVDLNGDG